MTNFEDLGLTEAILKATKAVGYTTPTPIQNKVIPVLLQGKDVLGVAQTGTGKTAAFVLPTLNRLHERGQRPQPKTCRSLILSPTRELTNQIADNVNLYSRFMQIKTTTVVGGASVRRQIAALSKGVDVLVATPGRLFDLCSSGAVDLSRTEICILDEADQMLDLGFFPTIKKIMSRLPAKRQTALLSATMPKQIRALAGEFLNNPQEVAVASESRPIERIDQTLRHVASERKKDLLADILSKSDMGQTIVFTRTKRGADRVHKHLETRGFASVAIHGNKSQGQRERALKDFRSNNKNILVATDVAARGIDIDDVSHVINYELPNVPESYVHRIGRTARAGRSGVAISLCDPSERKQLRDIEKLIGSAIPVVGAQPQPLPEENTSNRRKNGNPSANRKKRRPASPKQKQFKNRSERSGDAPRNTAPKGRRKQFVRAA